MHWYLLRSTKYQFFHKRINLESDNNQLLSFRSCEVLSTMWDHLDRMHLTYYKVAIY